MNYELQSYEMSFELKLAWKYFRSRRKSLVRFTSTIAVIGIATGVASLIIANAISKGFSDQMKSKVLSNTSHITIYDEGENVISNWQIIRQKVKQIENVESFEPTSYESAVVSSDEVSGYGILRVKEWIPAKGQRGKGRNKVENNEVEKKGVFKDRSVSSALADGSKSGFPNVSIGKELAEKLKLKIGDEANIITLENKDTPKNSRVFVKDVFETGLYEYDSTWIYIDQANYLKIKESNTFTPKVFSVSVKDIYKANETADFIRKELGEDFNVLDWQEANKPLFAALSLERKVALAIILLIIFIAIMNITTTLSLLVNERKLDIAVLRTCGAKTKNLVAVFLFEGMILSFTGIILGVTVGLSASFAGNYFKVISLSKQVYSLNYIPFNVDFWSVVIISLLTFLLSLLAIFYPALKASRIKPLENLRLR